MAISKKWKMVATGVAAASIGAAAFGAVHFMFLVNQVSTMPELIPGLPWTVLLPFIVGTAGFAIGVYRFSKKKDSMLAKVVSFGSAAIIGLGVAQYANWVTPVPQARARARLVAPIRRAPAPVRAVPTAGVKLI